MKKTILIKSMIGIAGAVALYCLHQRKPKQAPVSEKTMEERACTAEWTGVLRENARVFNGLFGGLQRVRDDMTQKPEKVLREWCQRTHNKWENELVDDICREYIIPLIHRADREELKRWANLLLDAAEDAGITKETAEKLELTEQTVADYLEWDDVELYPGDMIEPISPAWYQHGALLEQGMCRKVKTAAEEDGSI